MKKIFAVLSLIILLSLVLVIAQDDASDWQVTPPDTEIPAATETQTGTDTQEPEEQPQETGEQPQEPVEFDVDPGLTPDNPLYFVDDLVERVTIGDNPERALDYREEKIAEARVMVNEGKPEEAVRVLDRALNYGDVLEKEVSPEIRQRVEESSRQVQYVLDDMRNQTYGDEWSDVRDGFDENTEKGKKIEIASELVAKISELCGALAKLDPLQYSDTCRSKDDSPRWMVEQDKELTKEQQEQAKVFFDKLSQCFENPKECDCKGMGVQKFEDFCLEKSAIAVKCEGGDENACKEFTSGADPTELLPDYLISTFKKVEKKYIKSEFDMYMPPECEEQGATTPEECGKIMFSLNAPQECIDAGLTGKSGEDELKCRKIMFETNSPQECIDAGIDASDKDAPRKCAKIMFSINAPQECVDAGITGESRADEKKCRELMMSGETGKGYGQKPTFNRDCNSIQDANEKIKCYEEFYNNAQVQVREDFREGPGEYEGGCQTQEQVERLKQDCKNRGQDAVVEDRGGCPWVICVGGDYRGDYGGNYIRREPRQETTAGETGGNGMKCPDGLCDEYERMNPFACSEDCGGARQVRQEPMQDYQQPQQPMQPQEPMNRIDEPQQPYQPPQEPQPMPGQPVPSPEPAPTEPSPSPVPSPEPSPSPSPEPSAPTTGGVIGVSEPSGSSGNVFWDYWFGR